MIKKIIAISIIPACVGCASMLTHISFSDSAIREAGENIAVIDTCQEQRASDSGDVDAFKSAFAQLLTVSVYDQGQYAAGYASRKKSLEEVVQRDFRRSCREFNANAKNMTSMLIQRYENIASKRRADIGAMAQTLATPQVPQYNFQSNMPTPVQPNFGISKPASSSYLVDTGKGQRLCTVYPSGLAMCQ